MIWDHLPQTNQHPIHNAPEGPEVNPWNTLSSGSWPAARHVLQYASDPRHQLVSNIQID